jgi:hypothetical protein
VGHRAEAVDDPADEARGFVKLNGMGDGWRSIWTRRRFGRLECKRVEAHFAGEKLKR